MKTKEFITTVDKSLLTKQEVRIKTLFRRHPDLTLDEAVIVLEKGIEAVRPKVIEKPKPEVKPIIVEPVEPVIIDQPKPKPRPKPKSKAKKQ